MSNAPLSPQAVSRQLRKAGFLPVPKNGKYDGLSVSASGQNRVHLQVSISGGDIIKDAEREEEILTDAVKMLRSIGYQVEIPNSTWAHAYVTRP